ncbi:MAG: 4Fe-4S binding protein [Herpetosiphonaceae bacterium]|nr:4Fe-4S binding protein [Herpetosiphonaceae bacterium]
MSIVPASTSTALDRPIADVVVVRRNDNQIRAGQGMVKGMLRVVGHFGASLAKVQSSKRDTMGMFTVQYPEERLLLPEASRQMPILLYEDKSGQELCTSCFQCERVCPPQVIHITQAKDPTTGKPVPAAEEFVIEYDTCMSCGYCAEVCPFDAIKMDHVYELATPNHLSMDVHKRGLNRPVSYYETIAPTMWGEVRDQALKKLQNNVKRRSGNIGVAPQMQGKVVKAATGAAPRAVAAGAFAAPAAAKAPVAAAGKSMSADKLARLQAIRAAKAGGAATPVAEDEPAVMQTEAVAPEAAGVGPAGPAAAIGKNMSPEKVARLEAIRAGNQARHGG